MELLRLLARKLSRKWLLRVGRMAGFIAYAVAGKDRRRALKQLAQAIPAMGETERRRTVRDCFNNLSCTMLEALAAPAWSDAEMLGLVHNPEVLARVVEVSRSGQGAVFVVAHMGNWELQGAVFARQGGRTTALARRRDDGAAESFITKVRQENRISILFTDQSPRPALRAIRNGETVSILADQDITAIDGIFVDFFGRPAWTASAPASLSLTTGAPLYIALLLRDGEGFKVAFEGPFAAKGESKDERIASLTREWSSALEQIIRKHPGQWVWMHKRWRNTPERIARHKGARKEGAPETREREGGHA